MKGEEQLGCGDLTLEEMKAYSEYIISQTASDELLPKIKKVDDHIMNCKKCNHFIAENYLEDFEP